MSFAGGSRSTFLAFQSPGAMSAGTFGQLVSEAAGTGRSAENASQAIVAFKANPAAREITGSTQMSLASAANANASAASGSISDSRNRRSGDASGINAATGAINLAVYAQQQGVGWAQNKPELMS